MQKEEEKRELNLVCSDTLPARELTISFVQRFHRVLIGFEIF